MGGFSGSSSQGGSGRGDGTGGAQLGGTGGRTNGGGAAGEEQGERRLPRAEAHDRGRRSSSARTALVPRR